MTKYLNDKENQILDECFNVMKKAYKSNNIFNDFTPGEILSFLCGYLSRGIEKNEITHEQYYHIIDYIVLHELF